MKKMTTKERVERNLNKKLQASTNPLDQLIAEHLMDFMHSETISSDNQVEVAMRAAYQLGRREVLAELKAEQDKFLTGFGGKKILEVEQSECCGAEITDQGYCKACGEHAR